MQTTPGSIGVNDVGFKVFSDDSVQENLCEICVYFGN